MPVAAVGPTADVASFYRLLRAGLAKSLDDALSDYKDVQKALDALPNRQAEHDRAAAALEAFGRRRNGRQKLVDACDAALAQLLEPLEWPVDA